MHFNGTYDVYFLDDGQCLSNVNPQNIKIPLAMGPYTRNRSDLIGKKFYDSGSRKSIDGEEDFLAGEFIVKSVNPVTNAYVCERVPAVEGGAEGVEQEFFIGYVEKCVRLRDQQ